MHAVMIIVLEIENGFPEFKDLNVFRLNEIQMQRVYLPEKSSFGLKMGPLISAGRSSEERLQ
jgi:hypothetical protein